MHHAEVLAQGLASTLHSPHFPDANEEKSLPQQAWNNCAWHPSVPTKTSRNSCWERSPVVPCRREPKGKFLPVVLRLKTRFCPRLARYRARPDITKRQIAHCSTSRCWWRGSVCASLPERTYKGKGGGKHNVKFTVLVMFFLVMFFGDKCDAR